MKLIPCKFKNRNDLDIKGIVIEPDNMLACSKIGILYLPGSTLGSTAVHRLGIQIGEFLSSKGFITGLFDQAGVGESQGDIPDGTGAQYVQYIKEGNLTDATVEAIDYLINHYELDSVILIGHCGGALTGAYVAAIHHKVKGFMLISPPIGIDEAMLNRNMTRECTKLYKNKLLSLQAWKNLISGKTDYSLLFTVIKNKFLKSYKKDNIKTTSKDDALFMRKFNKICNRIKITSVMGDKDSSIKEYREFAVKYLKESGESKILKDSSHGFVTSRSLELLFNEINAFLNKFSKNTT